MLKISVTSGHQLFTREGGADTPGYTNRAFSLWIHNSAPSFHLTSAGDNSGQIIHECGDIILGEWVHYTAVIDREDHYTRVYLDGILVYHGKDAYSSFNENNSPLRFGWTEAINNTFSPFKGKLDDLRLYNRNLTDDEIRSLYCMAEGREKGLDTYAFEAAEDNWISKNRTYNNEYSHRQEWESHLLISEYTDFRGWLGSRKIWLSFDISELGDLSGTGDIQNASLLLTRSPWGNYNSSFIYIDVYGLTDQSLDHWDEQTIHWFNAPGNDINSRGVEPSKTMHLGRLIYNNDAASVGNRFSVSGKPLVDFLKSDSNGQVTFMLMCTYQTARWTSFESSETGIPGHSTPQLIVNTVSTANPDLSLNMPRPVIVEQYSSAHATMQIHNLTASSRVCTLSIVGLAEGLEASLESPAVVTLAPGDIQDISRFPQKI